MRATAFFASLVLGSFASFGLLGCAKAPAPEAGVSMAIPEKPVQKADVQRATTVKPYEKKKYGSEITEKTTTALNQLVKTPGKFSDKQVRTEGVVSAVCQGMGCWMELKDAAGQAHIKMAGHSFFVPKDASGHRAVVQGTVINVPKDHCTEEAEQQTGAVAKIGIEATGVEFID